MTIMMDLCGNSLSLPVDFIWQGNTQRNRFIQGRESRYNAELPSVNYSKDGFASLSSFVLPTVSADLLPTVCVCVKEIRETHGRFQRRKCGVNVTWMCVCWKSLKALMNDVHRRMLFSSAAPLELIHFTLDCRKKTISSIPQLFLLFILDYRLYLSPFLSLGFVAHE